MSLLVPMRRKERRKEKGKKQKEIKKRYDDRCPCSFRCDAIQVGYSDKRADGPVRAEKRVSRNYTKTWSG